MQTGSAPQPMRFTDDRRVLIAGAKDPHELLTFAVNPASGELALLGRTAAPSDPTYVSADRTGRVAFCASYAGNNLTVFPLDAHGAPGAAAQIESPLTRAHACLMDATNRWLIVPMLGEDAIRIYRLDDAGHLAPAEPPMVKAKPGSGPRHPVFSPDNRRLYCLNELDCTIDGFDFDAAHGRLELRHSTSILPTGFTGKPWAAELRATPDGRFLYASERTGSTIAAFAVDAASGQLQLIDHYPTETQPRGMDVDSTGHWLIAAGQLSDSLTVYALDPATGRLAPRQRVPTGQNPICVEIQTLA